MQIFSSVFFYEQNFLKISQVTLIYKTSRIYKNIMYTGCDFQTNRFMQTINDINCCILKFHSMCRHKTRRPYWITCARHFGYSAHATRPHARHLAQTDVIPRCGLPCYKISKCRYPMRRENECKLIFDYLSFMQNMTFHFL